MPEIKWGKVLDAVFRIAPIAFDWIADNVMKIGKGQMTPQEVREALSPIADNPERAERLDAIMDSPDLADAYQRASDVLDTD